MTKLLLFLLSGLFISNAYAASVMVFQESAPNASDFNANPLGSIQPFSTSGTLEEFYDYRGSEFKNTAAVSLTRNQSHLFLVDASDGLGLFVVHDNGQTNGGGRAETRVDLIGDSAAFLVQDEPAPDPQNRDSYTTNAPGTLFTAVNKWVSGFTDGYVIGALDGNWVLDLQFADASAIDSSTQAADTPTISGLETWAAISSDGSEIALVLQELRRVRLSVVPIPAALPLLLSAVAGLYFVGRWKRRNVA